MFTYIDEGQLPIHNIPPVLPWAIIMPGVYESHRCIVFAKRSVLDYIQ